MLASELANQLIDLIKMHGDSEVYFRDTFDWTAVERITVDHQGNDHSFDLRA